MRMENNTVYWDGKADCCWFEGDEGTRASWQGDGKDPSTCPADAFIQRYWWVYGERLRIGRVEEGDSVVLYPGDTYDVKSETVTRSPERQEAVASLRHGISEL